MIRNALIGMLVSASMGLVGCGSTQQRSDASHGLVALETLTADDGFDARALTVHRGDATGTVSYASMVETLSGAQVILVGEVHGHSAGLDFIATLYDDLADEGIASSRERLDLSMEFYERDHQAVLDDYASGIIDRATMAQLTLRNLGNNPVGHQRMVERAVADGARVIAANAPRRHVRAARTMGYDALTGLSAEQSALFVIPDPLPQGAYRDRFTEAMGGMALHGGDEMVTSFFRAQTMWDATMADSVVRSALRGNRVFHVVGHFHVDFAGAPGGSAMTDMIRDGLGIGHEDRATIRTVVVHLGDHGSLMGADVGAADFVVYVAAE